MQRLRVSKIVVAVLMGLGSASAHAVQEGSGSIPHPVSAQQFAQLPAAGPCSEIVDKARLKVWRGEGFYLVKPSHLPPPDKLLGWGPSDSRLFTTFLLPFGYLEWLTDKGREVFSQNNNLIVGLVFLDAKYKIDPLLLDQLTKGQDTDRIYGTVWFWFRKDHRPKDPKDEDKDIPYPIAGNDLEFEFFEVVNPTLKEVRDLADLRTVVKVEIAGKASLRNAITSWVIQTNQDGVRSFFDKGIRGQGQVIGLIDDLIDRDHCFFRDPQKFKGYRASGGFTEHGTFVAGILAGKNVDSPDFVGNGQAPDAQLSFDWFQKVTGLGGTPSNLGGFLQAEYTTDGARVFSNSWGDDGRRDYTRWAYDADYFSFTNEDALVLFAVSNKNYVMSPENGRNVLAVGASGQATSRDVFGSGGRGTTVDGRRKPEIFAPGCGIQSSVPGSHGDSCDLSFSHDPSFCATSWACPAVAGAGALVRQYFVEGRYPDGDKVQARTLNPSGALVKAVLLNGTMDMTKVPAQQNQYPKYPNDLEGWGRLNLDQSLVLPGESQRKTWIQDIRMAQGFTAPGMYKCWKFHLSPSNEPLKVTLVWTEKPVVSICGVPPIVNDLNLTLSSGSKLFVGNVFDPVLGESAPQSSTPSYDPLNNVEQIVVKSASAADDYKVSVKAERIAVSPQGFALVVSGALAGAFTPCDAE